MKKIAQPSVNPNWKFLEPDHKNGACKRVVLLESEEGQERIKNSQNAKSIVHYTRQKHCTYCGIATASYIINTLKGKEIVTEDSFWNQFGLALKGVVNEKVVKVNGLTLNDFHNTLLRLGPSLKDSFQILDIPRVLTTKVMLKNKIRRPLSIHCCHLLLKNKIAFINYQPASLLGMEFEGHFSPVAACSGDYFLVLDVWTDSSPMWVLGDDLWDTINTKDSDSKISRGWGIVKCKY